MSYAQITPEIYQVFQQDTPWEVGAKGWWSAPIPGWGENPNLLDTPRKAIQGLGCGGGCGCSGAKGVGSFYGQHQVSGIRRKGVGAYYPTETVTPIPMGSYYEGGSGGQAVFRGFGEDAPVAPAETPKPSFGLVHLGVAALAGFVIAKML